MLLKVVNLTLKKLLDQGYKIVHIHHRSTNLYKVVVNNSFYGRLDVYEIKTVGDALNVCSFLYLESQYKSNKEDTFKLLEEEGLELFFIEKNQEHNHD